MAKSSKPKKGLKPTIWILCEGETEECYFSIIKQNRILGKNIEIIKIGQISGKSLNKIKDKIKKVKYTNKELRVTNSKVFLILDADAYTPEKINFIKNEIENKYVKVLFSNKNFELWILLHLQDCNKENVDYKKLIKKHKNGDKNYEKGEKNRKFFEKIIKNLKDAIKRAKKLEEIHKNKENIKYKIPYTEVYKCFEKNLQ